MVLLNSINETQCIKLEEKQLNKLNEFLTKHPIKKEHITKYLSAPNPKANARTEVRSGLFSGPVIPSKSKPPGELREFQELLPAFKLRDVIIDTISRHRVTLITGGTGCGKTTQVPQFLLDQACSSKTPIQVVCTQPRRLPCIAVAKRVARERGEKLGETIGYHIRLEQKQSEKTVLTYCTSGVLLRMLTADEMATGITHIVLDEIHEREKNTDYLLIALKQALIKRDDLKIILMSATMEGNLDVFIKYFDQMNPGYVDIPSRLFSVEKFYLPEILALTGYMPSSSWGTFTSGDGFGNKSSEFESSSFDRFPVVDEYNCASSTSVTNPRTSFPAQQNPYSNGGMHVSMTEPNLFTYRNQIPQRNPFQFGQNQPQFQLDTSSSEIWGLGGGFSAGRLEKKQEQVANYVERVFYDRPRNFDARYLPHLRQNWLVIPEEDLITTYMRAGGQQWIEGVDIDLVIELIGYLLDCKEPGAILVFLPGFDDIASIRNAVERRFVRRSSGTCAIIHSLHSQINSNEQQRVFDKVHAGFRKVILSTNIAEASLTIDDVIFVIDCGKAKEKTYDPDRNITQLKTNWIAKSNAEQRAGRAGRCRDGFCFRIYTSNDYKKMAQSQTPEMLRMAIHEVCLHAKMFAPNSMTCREFLAQAPEPPSSNAVDKSLEFLEQLGALYTSKSSTTITTEIEVKSDNAYAGNPQYTSKQSGSGFSSRGFGSGNGSISNWLPVMREPDITELGRIIVHLPLEPQFSRLLLFGIALRCFSPILTLVSALAHRDPFLLPMEDDRQQAISIRETFSRMDFSDHIVLIRAYNEFQRQDNKIQFCESKFLSFPAMKMIQGIRRQLIFELKRLNLLPSDLITAEEPDLNKYSHEWTMVQAAIVAGCFPDIAYVRPGTKLRKIKTRTQDNAALHPSSIIKRQVQPSHKRSAVLNRVEEDENETLAEYFAYQELTRIDEGLTLKMITVVPPLTVFFFAGPIRLSSGMFKRFEIDDYSDKKKNERLADESKIREELLERKRAYRKQLRLNARRNAELCRRNVMQHLEVQLDSPKNPIDFATSNDDWIAADDDSVSDVDMDESSRFYLRDDHILELESWLAFRGTFESMQSLTRLRFKFMRYFLRMLKRPNRTLRTEDHEMLECLSALLKANHKQQHFYPCDGLYEQAQRSEPRIYQNRNQGYKNDNNNTSFFKNNGKGFQSHWANSLAGGYQQRQRFNDTPSRSLNTSHGAACQSSYDNRPANGSIDLAPLSTQLSSNNNNNHRNHTNNNQRRSFNTKL